METPPTVQGESEEHFASLPIGHYGLLKQNVRVLFFLRTQLNRKQINQRVSLDHLKSSSNGWGYTHFMDGEAVIVLIYQGHWIAGRIVILISGNYLQCVLLPTGKHQSREMANNFGFGGNHHPCSRKQLSQTNAKMKLQRAKKEQLGQNTLKNGSNLNIFYTPTFNKWSIRALKYMV